MADLKDGATYYLDSASRIARIAQRREQFHKKQIQLILEVTRAMNAERLDDVVSLAANQDYAVDTFDVLKKLDIVLAGKRLSYIRRTGNEKGDIFIKAVEYTSKNPFAYVGKLFGRDNKEIREYVALDKMNDFKRYICEVIQKAEEKKHAIIISGLDYFSGIEIRSVNTKPFFSITELRYSDVYHSIESPEDSSGKLLINAKQ